MKLHACALAVTGLLVLPAGAQEKVDLLAIHRIKEEAFRSSKVMDHLFWLTDVNGPRLAASPGYRAAADWSVRALKEWGIGSARLEKWGTFGRGWSLTRFEAHLMEPAYAPLAGVPKAWSGGTDGRVTGEVVSAPFLTPADKGVMLELEKLPNKIRAYAEEHKGKLRGKIVLITAPRELAPPTQAASQRYDETSLASIAAAPDPASLPRVEFPLMRMPVEPEKRELYAWISSEITVDFYARQGKILDELNAFLRDEGILAILSGDERGDGGIAFSDSRGVGPRRPYSVAPPPMVVLPPESYDRICRLVEKKIPVKVELDVEVKFNEPPDGLNVVAEIPGGKKKDEVVMLGAHLDSWHGGTGATDNAAGCAVALETMRILKTLGLPMDRTVRLALWDAEEQGHWGSRGYVKRHFGDPVTMELKPEHAKVAGYFNVDNGTGKIRGVYLQGNDMARPIFAAWLEPFQDLGADTLAIDHTGGTDHQSFDAVGLPGFQFIQDPLDYSSRTHHSNLDVYDHLVPGDLMQASAILASFVYNAAMRAEMLPRQPLPKPLPKAQQQPVGDAAR